MCANLILMVDLGLWWLGKRRWNLRHCSLITPSMLPFSGALLRFQHNGVHMFSHVFQKVDALTSLHKDWVLAPFESCAAFFVCIEFSEAFWRIDCFSLHDYWYNRHFQRPRKRSFSQTFLFSVFSRPVAKTSYSDNRDDWAFGFCGCGRLVEKYLFEKGHRTAD